MYQGIPELLMFTTDPILKGEEVCSVLCTCMVR